MIQRMRGSAAGSIDAVVPGCTSDVSLLPGPNQPGQQDQEQAIGSGDAWSFHLSPEDDELLA